MSSRSDGERWDVVVVGAGNAALVAALSAHQSGARVLVLEAASRELRGGNSRFSGGIFRFVHEGLDDLGELVTDGWRERARQVDVGPYTEEHYVRDLVDTSRGQSDRELVDVLASESRETVRWMRDVGVRWELTIGKLVDPAKVRSDFRYALPAGGAVRSVEEGTGLVRRLFEAVDAAGIDVWYDSPAHDLLASGDQVEGVRVRTRDRFVDLRGTVVLACGGFESSPEMRRRYLGVGWDLVKVRGTRFNTGLMLRRAMDAGAQSYGHWGGCHASPLDADAPAFGDLALTDKLSRYSYPFGILVNADGRRFVDEGEDEVWLTYAKTGSAIREQPRGIAFQVFDQKAIQLLEPRYATGTPLVAGSLRELADLLQIDGRALEQTVAEYNDATPGGTFDPFSKDGLATEALSPPKSNWAQRIDQPPYVAYRVMCGITFTYGGLHIDASARVLNAEGRPMPGLFATGEITGGFFAHNYPAGAGLARGAVFGRIAGAQAARLAGSGAILTASEAT